jgi:hypothetical protein
MNDLPPKWQLAIAFIIGMACGTILYFGDKYF